MADDGATRARRYRNKKRGGKPRQLKTCPSYPAFMRHKRRVAANKPNDCTDPEGCQEAYNAHQRDMYAGRKAKQQ